MTDTLKHRPLFALACLAPLIVLTLVMGSVPDPDRAAHTMWARQIVETGRLTISRNGVVDDWRLFYPNTVPKPGDLALSLAGVITGPDAETALWLILAWVALLGGMGAASGKAPSILTGVFLGVNPVFLNLCITRSPGIPFLALVFLGAGARGGAAAALASLVRPEGFIYGAWRLISGNRRTVVILLAVSAGAWAALNALAAGDIFWSGREVRHCVAAMAYRTPNLVTFPPWVLLRAVMVLGPLPMAVLSGRLGRWNLRWPVALNLLFLWIGLGFGSLVLPRYTDQVFLLAVPFTMTGAFRLFRRIPGTALAALCLMGALIPWGETLGSWRTELFLRERMPGVARALPGGVIAANELIVPGLALLTGVWDPGGRFVALDRAVWEGAGADDLKALGVTAIVTFDDDFYMSCHAREWLSALDGGIPLIPIEEFPGRE